MTMLAGAFSLRPGVAPPETVCTHLLQRLSRRSTDHYVTFSAGSCFLVKIDTGAYGYPAQIQSSEGDCTFLVGDPLLADRPTTKGRDRDTVQLHSNWVARDHSGLKEATGVFAAVHYSARSDELQVVTDKLGLRPVYWWSDDDTFVFATSLRIFEEAPYVPKTLDLRGAAEQVCFGFPLGSRTPLVGVNLMDAGARLCVSSAGLTPDYYWRWDTLQEAAAPIDDAAARIFAHFRAAIRRRAGDSNCAYAFLSGGLDSRAIVSLLRAEGLETNTVNFSPPSSRDQVFARAFAEASGCSHHERPNRESNPAWSAMMATVLASLPERPRTRLVWSGDGGSVGLGHVYLNAELVQLFRNTQDSLAIKMYLQSLGAHVPVTLRARLADCLDGAYEQGVAMEMSRLMSTDRGRAFHLFLMLNDQRRHLYRHFEDIDTHRLEFHLPFYDSAFLSAVIATPLDFCLGHTLYMKVLTHFPDVTLKVPWQTYPGHVPCPLEVPAGLGYQWAVDTQDSFAQGRREGLLSTAWSLARAAPTTRGILRPWALWLAWIAHRFRLKDCAYIIDAASTFARYGALARGRWTFTPLTSQYRESS